MAALRNLYCGTARAPPPHPPNPPSWHTPSTPKCRNLYIRPGTPVAALRNLYRGTAAPSKSSFLAHSHHLHRQESLHTASRLPGQELLRPPCETFIVARRARRTLQILLLAHSRHLHTQESLHTASRLPVQELGWAPCETFSRRAGRARTIPLSLPYFPSKSRNLYIRPPTSQSKNSGRRLAKP